MSSYTPGRLEQAAGMECTIKTSKQMSASAHRLGEHKGYYTYIESAWATVAPAANVSLGLCGEESNRHDEGHETRGEVELHIAL